MIAISVIGVTLVNLGAFIGSEVTTGVGCVLFTPMALRAFRALAD